MSWITLSADDIKRGLSATEFETFTETNLADGQTTASLVAGLLSDVTERIRGDVMASRKFSLGASGTIPSRLRRAARALLVMDVMSRPGSTIIDDENRTRAKAADAAEALLLRVAEGTYPIVDADGNDVSQHSISVVHSNTRHETRDNLKGL